MKEVKKFIGVAAGAVLLAGGTFGGAALAASGGSPNTTPNAADGFYACIAAGNKPVNAYPADGWHGTQCPSGQELYLFPSQAGMQKAIDAAVEAIPAGPKGDPGVDGVSGYVVAKTDATPVDVASGVLTLTATCPEGKVATGGGLSTGTGGAFVTLRASYPSVFNATGIPAGWAAKVSATGAASVRAWATCATAQ